MTSTKEAALERERIWAGNDLPGMVDHIFIDEAQDLPTVVLKAIKSCARKYIVLAWIPISGQTWMTPLSRK